MSLKEYYDNLRSYGSMNVEILFDVPACDPAAVETEEIQMNHPTITKMLSDERIRAFTAQASPSAAIGRSARRRDGAIAHWVPTAMTNLLHARSTSTSASCTLRRSAT